MQFHADLPPQGNDGLRDPICPRKAFSVRKVYVQTPGATIPSDVLFTIDNRKLNSDTTVAQMAAECLA
jgi:hypothetical protein